jgi:transposase
MPAPYPVKLRESAVASYEAGGGTYETVAATFGISIPTLECWVRRFRGEGTVEPRPKGGGNFSEVQLDVLLGVLADHPSAVVSELTREYNKSVGRKAATSESSIKRALKRAGFVFKRNGSGLRSKTGRTWLRSGRRSQGGSPA